MILLFLTCANKKEASKIALILLKKHLIVCAKFFPVSSSYLWKGKIENASEVLLIMDTKDSLFNKIENEIRKIHSYDLFVLNSIAVTKVSRGIKEWMIKELI